MKLSEMIMCLNTILQQHGNKDVYVGDLSDDTSHDDEDGGIVLLEPAPPEVTEGGDVCIQALFPLGCFGGHE